MSGIRPSTLGAPPKSSPALATMQPPPSSAEYTAVPTPAEGEHLVRRLKVIDGADQGHSFLVSEQSVVTVGSNSKHAEVCLHDLYVARVHCQLQVEDDHLIVKALDATRPTFINSQQIDTQILSPGDVLRVGNSYLRLELEVASSAPAPAPGAPGKPAAPQGPVKIPRLPLDKLTELAGYTLGHFQLEKALGAGPHGVVFRARDLKTEQEVALKVLSADFPADEAEMQRFIQAMKVALTLRHPSLVALQGVGKSGPYCWISRELVEGVGLNKIINPSGKSREGLDWRLALRVSVQIARALEDVHRHHLVHTNVTPQNILLEGDEGQAKLSDLMLRKAIDGSVLWNATEDARYLADLPYLAPEQTEPGAFVDNLCDLYGLGVVAYALMTGRLPFRGKTPEETLEQIRDTVPTKPKKFEKSIPMRFQEVVLKLLAKRQEDRYATATALLADLDEIARQRNVAV
jgi:hypothetical protein